MGFAFPSESKAQITVFVAAFTCIFSLILWSMCARVLTVAFIFANNGAWIAGWAFGVIFGLIGMVLGAGILAYLLLSMFENQAAWMKTGSLILAILMFLLSALHIYIAVGLPVAYYISMAIFCLLLTTSNFLTWFMMHVNGVSPDGGAADGYVQHTG